MSNCTASIPWQTTKRAGIPCGTCGKLGTCTVSPDGTAFKCWKDGGRVHQLNGRGSNGNGTGYVGKAHRPKPAESDGDGKTFRTFDEALKAVAKWTRGTVGGQWAYHRADGSEFAHIVRFDLADGSKKFWPIHQTKQGWRIEDPKIADKPEPWPLYRLNELAPNGVLWVGEGEKCADAARAIGLPAITSAHGSSSAAKSDWAPLAGRDVCILPDNDPPGEKYARDVSAILAKLDPPARVKIVRLPDLPEGGDVCEFIDARDSSESEAIAAEIIALADAARFIEPAELLGGLVTRCLADVEAEQLAWLWPYRFALGKVSLIGGVPGVGKSWLSLYIAAAISRAMAWPDGRGNAPLGSALIANAEDGAADTIKPRLLAMGADCRRIHVLDCVRLPGENGKLIECGFTLTHVPSLEETLKRLGDVRAIVIDPVSAYLAEADEHRNGEIRALLKPLARLAERYSVAIILVTHLTKNGSANSVHRMIGSIGFAGAARSVWMVAKDKADPKRRLLLLAKCNVAPDQGGLAYSIVDGSIAWEAGSVNESADDVLAAENREGDGGDDCNDNDTWLRAELADFQEHPVADLRKAVNEAGLNWRNVQRAASRLKVKRERSGFGGGFIWRLPKPA